MEKWPLVCCHFSLPHLRTQSFCNHTPELLTLLLSLALHDSRIQAYIEITSTHKKLSEKCLRKSRCWDQMHSITFTSDLSPNLDSRILQTSKAQGTNHKLVVLQIITWVCMSRTDACGPQDRTDWRQLWISQHCELMTQIPISPLDHSNRFLASNPILFRSSLYLFH